MPTFDALPETHIERMDRLEFERQEKLELAKIDADAKKYAAKMEHRSNRQETWQVGLVALAITGVLSAIIYAIWIDDDPAPGPEEYKNSESYREERCVTNGGGWVPKDLLVSGADKGLCVFPGQSVEEPAVS